MPSRLLLTFFALAFLLSSVGLQSFSVKAQDLDFEVPAEEFSDDEIPVDHQMTNSSDARARRLPPSHWLWLIVPALVGWACWAQSRRDAATAEASVLSWHNAKLQEEADRSVKLAAKLTDVRNRLANQEAEARTVQQQLYSQLKDADANIASLNAENVDAQRKLESAKREKSTADAQEPDTLALMAKIDTQQDEAKQLRNHLETVRTENESLRRSLDAQHTEFSSLQTENANLETKCADQQKQLSDLQQLSILAQQEQQASGHAYAQLKAESERIETELRESRIEVESLNEANADYQDQVAQLGQKLDQAQHRLSQSQATCRENAERLQASYGELNSLKHQLDSGITQQQRDSEAEYRMLRTGIESIANQVAAWAQKRTQPSPAAIRARFDKSRRSTLRLASSATLAGEPKRIRKSTSPPKSRTTVKATLDKKSPRKSLAKSSKTDSSTRRMRTAAKAKRKPSKVKRKPSPKKPAKKSRPRKPGSVAPVAPADRLTKIAGIGPKTAALLQSAGITSYRDLVKTQESKLRAILAQGGKSFQRIDPSKWPLRAANEIREKKPKPRPKRR